MTRVERRSVEQSGLDGATRIFMAMQPALMKHVETVVAKARGNGRIGEVLELIHDLAEALNLNAESVNVKCKPVERFIWEENNGRHDEAYSLDERLAGLLDSLLSVFICVKRGGSVDGVFKTFNVYSYLLFVTLLLILRIKQSGNTARAVLINPPPDISPTVVLLIVAFILAPRAPQFCPKVA
ncbi:hypothetical protein PT279_00270 [Bifidobacterium sp. ESL0784]|uniref:hypothetical protein n=1 Tax=Bifidobacterium sp. ESL0784 TaxID=2983231 RepID=UPI0023F85565|nr:hypothetical protein [Bifidobacterium sp. ESL0784]MDF7640042.1 hypothetical protein [Bifidobacterium sp. ESL0784]